MNILPLPKTMKLAALTLAVAGMTTSALAADSAPQFSVAKTATRTIASGASAFQKGDFQKSIAFSRYALKQGLKKSRKAVAYSNLCAALGAEGRYDEAVDACDSALKIAPQNWQAFSNRAAVNWLSGDKMQALQDIEAAKTISPEAGEITHNLQVFG